MNELCTYCLHDREAHTHFGRGKYCGFSWCTCLKFRKEKKTGTRRWWKRS